MTLSASCVVINVDTIDRVLTDPTIIATKLGDKDVHLVVNQAALTKLNVASIGCVFDGGGSAIAVDSYVDVSIPYACTINSNVMLADQSGSIVIDVRKDTYTNFPPAGADSICASAKPTISGAAKSTDTTLTGWSTTITAGDTIRFYVESCTTITKCTLVLKVTKS